MLIFSKFGGRGAPMGVGIGGVSEFIQVVYTKTLDICYIFATFLNLIFDYPFYEEGVLLWDRQWCVG